MDSKSTIVKCCFLLLGLSLAALFVWQACPVKTVPVQSEGRRLKTDFLMQWELDQEHQQKKERIDQSVAAAMKHIAAATSTTKVEGSDDDEVDASLTKAQKRLAQWKLHSSEVILKEAAVNAEDTFHDLDLPENQGKKTEQQQHAARMAVQALTRWGVFEAEHGQSTEAIDALKHAIDLATWLGKGSMQAVPEDLSLLARARSGHGRALCKGKGHQGRSLEEARKEFQDALKLVSEVDALKPDATLSAKVHLEFSECLHLKGEVPAAQPEIDAALTAAAGVPAGPEKKRLSQRILKMRALVQHDSGADNAAASLYKEYLAVVGEMQPSSLPDPDLAEEYFEMVQNTIIMLLSEGRIDEGIARLDALKSLQKAADRKLHSVNDKKFLAPTGGLNIGFWAAEARTKAIESRLLLASSQDAKKSNKERHSTWERAHAAAVDALAMMRKGQNAQDLIDALHTLGQLERDIGDKRYALALFKEAMDISEKECGSESMCIASSSHNMAQALEESGDLEGALKLFQRGLQVMIKVLGIGNPDTATAYDSVAYMLEKTGRDKEALEVAMKSLESARAAYPAGHKYITEAEDRLAHLKGKTGENVAVATPSVKAEAETEHDEDKSKDEDDMEGDEDEEADESDDDTDQEEPQDDEEGKPEADQDEGEDKEPEQANQGVDDEKDEDGAAKQADEADENDVAVFLQVETPTVHKRGHPEKLDEVEL
eukprot:gnl/TRDRNA2_/TRDRNA2_175717_c0_seq6.p1 gnl/TRDRNA2_/TRDRNA2_175717_c0~~gnl/TRDRNA2_/TRDRNA2_175717_c0_seq6.p1  ORF type:complete len:715 (-),score=224.34 gnl/TRDRNA2_/TRDRNA2_175717_c0_seq6:23-2167(-)